MKKPVFLVVMLALLLAGTVSAVAQELPQEMIGDEFSVVPVEGIYSPYDPNQELVAAMGILQRENVCFGGYYVIDEVTGDTYTVGAYDEHLWRAPGEDILTSYEGQLVTVYGTVSENDVCGPHMTVYWVEPMP